jgi:hypothetical protein
MVAGTAIVLGMAASTLSAQVAQRVASPPQDELPTPIVSSFGGPPASGAIVYAPPAVIPAPWRWEQNEVPPQAAAIAGDEGTWTPSRPLLWEIQPPGPVDDNALPPAAFAPEEGVAGPLPAPLWWLAPLAAPADDGALPLVAASIAFDEGVWPQPGPAFWDYDPIWFIDGTSAGVPPQIDEVYAVPVLGPPGFWCAPVVGWGADLDMLPVAAAPIGIDEGHWVAAWPLLWPVAPLVAADDPVLPIAAATIAGDEGTWTPPFPILRVPVFVFADDDRLAFPPAFSDEGIWVNPIPPLWSTFLVRPWIYDTGDWTSGYIQVFRLRDASRPEIALRERSQPEAQLDAIDRPDAILREQGRPELEAEHQSRPDATLRDRSRP